MKLLAIETSGSGGSVALSVDDNVAELSVTETRQQTAQILPMIDELLRGASLKVANLDVIAFGHGPGSFTGLRVAAAVAQGLSLATGTPIASVSSMAAMLQRAWQAHDVERALICIDARMGEVYWGEYQIVGGLAKAVRPDAIGVAASVEAPSERPYACIGDGFGRYEADLALALAAAGVVLLDLAATARDLIPLAMAAAREKAFVEPIAALPSYLRDSSAWRSQR
jgi:tRNA threonylcarbamoyladenosine biosynthesis protein TsaB